MGVLRYHCLFFCLLIFRSIIRVNIRTGGNKNKDFQFYFFNLPNNKVGGSVKQSIIKKGLIMLYKCHYYYAISVTSLLINHTIKTINKYVPIFI